MNNYYVVLDERCSKIIPSNDGGMTFNSAVNHILEYTKEAGYGLQEAFFEYVKESGEDVFSNGNHTINLS